MLPRSSGRGGRADAAARLALRATSAQRACALYGSAAAAGPIAGRVSARRSLIRGRRAAAGRRGPPEQRPRTRAAAVRPRWPGAMQRAQRGPALPRARLAHAAQRAGRFEGAAQRAGLAGAIAAQRARQRARQRVAAQAAGHRARPQRARADERAAAVAAGREVPAGRGRGRVGRQPGGDDRPRGGGVLGQALEQGGRRRGRHARHKLVTQQVRGAGPPLRVLHGHACT